MNGFFRNPAINIKNEDTRIRWIDICKAFAIFAIVYGHTALFGNIGGYVSSFHVPLFVFLSGVLFVLKPDQSFGCFLWKKFKHIMIPYYCFGIISIVIYTILGSFASDSLDKTTVSFNPVHNLLGMLYANGDTGYMKWNLPLWFLPAIYVLYAVFYWVVKSAEKYEKRKWPVIYICFAGMFLAFPYIQTKWFCSLNLPFGIETALNLSCFFAMGLAFKSVMNIFLKLSRSTVTVLGILAIVCGAVLYYFNSPVSYIANIYGCLPLYFAAASFSIFGYVLLAMAIRKCYIVEYIGANTMSILLMHKFPILFFQTILPVTGRLLKQGNVSAEFFVAAITVMLTLVADRIISLFAPFMIGKSKLHKDIH